MVLEMQMQMVVIVMVMVMVMMKKYRCSLTYIPIPYILLMHLVRQYPYQPKHNYIQPMILWVGFPNMVVDLPIEYVSYKILQH